MKRIVGVVFAVMLVSSARAQDAVSQASSVGDEKLEAAWRKLSAKGFILEYRVEGQNFIGKLSYGTTGWVAVGFEPSKKMKDANFIIGYAGAGGESVVKDHFGISATAHKADTEIGGQDNIIDGRCEEKDGVTTMWFSIPLDSGDPKDVKMEPGKEIKVIFAAGKKDDLTSKHVGVASSVLRI